jgi:hypothetical protein
MSDPRIPLKNPLLGAFLAYLIPGMGHLYQGRFFKAVLYSTCILGTFFCGMYLANWKAVYYSSEPGKRPFGYYAQVGVGLPALYALAQSRRYFKSNNVPLHQLDAPLSAEFTGSVTRKTAAGDTRETDVAGTITLEPRPGEFGVEPQGTFSGKTADGESIELPLGGTFFLDRKVAASRDRALHCDIIGHRNGRALVAGRLVGSIPRRFSDWFEAPVDDTTLQKLNQKLGKTFDLALVFTWIAGLLNILAVWDALEGPAYSYGDETESDDADSPRKKKAKTREPEVAISAQSSLDAAEPNTKSLAGSAVSPPASESAATSTES